VDIIAAKHRRAIIRKVRKWLKKNHLEGRWRKIIFIDCGEKGRAVSSKTDLFRKDERMKKKGGGGKSGPQKNI